MEERRMNECGPTSRIEIAHVHVQSDGVATNKVSIEPEVTNKSSQVKDRKKQKSKNGKKEKRRVREKTAYLKQKQKNHRLI